MGFIMAEIAEKTENTVHIQTDGFSDRETKNDKNIQVVIYKRIGRQAGENELDFTCKLWYIYKAVKKMLV